MEIELLSLFPSAFPGPLELSIVGKAQEKGLLTLKSHDIRKFGVGKHKRVDERPYGGGPGMVMTPGPIKAAIASVKRADSQLVYLTPQGVPLTAKLARSLAKKAHLICLCGHYEGVDERALEGALEVSVGDVVLSNGILPAMVLIDATARFIPGVLGHEEGAEQESFEEGIFDYPQYAGPKEGVPELLFSGHHARIERWRKKKALEKTKKVRPDLFWDWLSPPSQVILGVKDLKASYRFFKGVGLGCEKKDKGLIIEGFVTLLEGEFGTGVIRLTLPKGQFEKVRKKITPLISKESFFVIEDLEGNEWCLQGDNDES